MVQLEIDHNLMSELKLLFQKVKQAITNPRIEMMYKLVAAAIVASVSAVKVGDMVPDVNLDYGFPPEKINLYQRVMGKKVRQPNKNTTLA